MAQILFIAYITQLCVTLCAMLGLSLWVVDADDSERHGPEWSRRYRFLVIFGGAMASLMVATLILAAITKICSL